MSKVFAGNVFISTSRQAIEKVFFAKNKLSNYTDRIVSLTEEELKRSLLVTPNKNSNLISLDYSFGGSVNADSNFLKLKFVETDSLFEFFYINKTVGSTLLTKLIQELDQNDLREKKTVAGSYNRSNVYGNFISNSSDAVLNDGRIFFAFGVGNDTKEWAGPFVADLYSSDLTETADGIREITLIYTTTPSYFLSNLINTKTSDGLETAINKYRRVLSNKRTPTAKAEVETRRGDIEANMHSTITQLVKRYISVCTNNRESIVLLPDLDYSYFSYKASKLPDIRRLIQSSNRDGVFKPSTIGPVAKADAARRNIVDPVKKALESQLQDFLKDLGVAIEHKSTPTSKLLLPLTPEIAQEYLDPTDNKNIILSISSKLENKPDDARLNDYFFPLYLITEFFTQIYPSITKLTNISELEYYEECDVRILKLWKKYKFIEDDTRPVIVYGSRSIIQHLMYLSNVVDIQALTDESNLVEGVHKDDKAFYYNKGYRYEYFDEFIKNRINSSFGEDVLALDGLELKNFDPNYIKFIGIPIFRFNVANSNILGLSVDYKQSYTTVYNLALKQKSLLPFVNTTISYITKLVEEDVSLNKNVLSEMLSFAEAYIPTGEKKPNQFTDLLALVTKWYGENEKWYGPGSIKGEQLKNTKLTREELILYLALVLSSNFKLGDSLAKPFLEINGSADLYIQDFILKQLESVALQVRIKTLPFFKLSNIGALTGKRVLLLGANNTIIGSTNKKKLMPYSGLYVISEFRHYVGSDDMYSEFTLNKIISETGDIDLVDSKGLKTTREALHELEKRVSK